MPLEYLPLVSVLIGFLVRILKSDTRLPINVPAEYRPHLAWALGVAAGIVDLAIDGVPMKAAILAVCAPLIAQAGHVGIVEIARGGREFPVPGLMRKPKGARVRYVGPVSIVLLCASIMSGCAGVPVSPEVARVADPILRAAGFCREHVPAERVDAIVDAYLAGDKVGPTLQLAAILNELRQDGVPVPKETLADVVEAMAAVRSLEIGLRALDNRDADGNKLPLPPDPELAP